MKRYLLILFMALSCAPIFAQEYKPMLKEGRVWKVVRPSFERRYSFDMYYTVKVDGDTIVNGIECKKIISTCDIPRPWGLYNATWIDAAYEKDGKVYGHSSWGFDDDEFHLIMDFNMKVGDTIGEFPYSMEYTIEKIDYIEVNGEKYRRFTLSEGYNKKSYWVEGIGSSEGNWITQEVRWTGNYSQYALMLGCIDDGKVVFLNEDFDRWIPDDDKPDAVEKVTVEKKADGRMYNIAGQRIGKAAKGELYIKDGEKRVGE